MNSGCLDESLVVAFLGGTLPAIARAEAEAHIADCTACSDLVTWAAADVAAAASRAPGSEGHPFVGQLTPGSRVGRYQILGAVGRGGMGEVYAAYHPDLDRRIALKVVNESGANSSERRTRLLREARAIARLSHPNVVAVHDAGTLGDRVFIAMEFVDGQTVDEWLRAAPRTWRQILDVFVAAGYGLAAAHAANIVHRDFKPQNVMIDKDGSVRVMDFGLARLVQEDGAVATAGATEPLPAPAGTANKTKTGALLGTPAYMSPEQFRGGAIDARSDQFSFCVALHEALFGGARPDESTTAVRRSNVPGWLRSIVLRGAAIDRDHRYDSMATLLAVLQRGRTRLRRRSLTIGAALAATLLVTGGWRLARGEKVSCSIPEQRVAAAWAADNTDNSRRQAIHAAFVASGRQNAEMIWQRLSSTMDQYIRAWGTTYQQTCEATHVRGEQSAEVLDLRMSCLNDNLEQVRALTDTLLTADAEVVGKALEVSKDLTPVARCGDVALLRSAVPLPRDERTFREVQRLRRSLADLDALRDVGKTKESLEKAIALRPEVDATGYRPLLGQLLFTIGSGQTSLFRKEAEETLETSVLTAVAAHDDLTAAKAATDLIYVLGTIPGRDRDSERWYRVANSILDRLGDGHARIRAWALQNYGLVVNQRGSVEEARIIFERAVALKEQILGNTHLDVAVSLTAVADTLVQLGRAQDALPLADRAVQIYRDNVAPESVKFANPLNVRGDVLRVLGRRVEARSEFDAVLRIGNANPGSDHPFLFDAAAGVGQIELAEGRPAQAVPWLRKAVDGYARVSAGQSVFAMSTRFALARALWQSGVDRGRAVSLAREAQQAYASQHHTLRADEVASWLRSISSSTVRGTNR